MLFGKRRENKIRVRHGKESQLRLTALRYALAPGAARAYRDLRLNQLIPSPLRVALGVEEAHDACFLIRLKGGETHRYDHQCDHPDGQPVLPWQAREEDAHRQN